jgi:hypothetical protein
MSDQVEAGVEKGDWKFGRILKRDLFLFLLDIEVKRARRYQNFLSVIILKLVPNPSMGGSDGLQVCHKFITGLLTNEMRETDLLGYLDEDKMVVLLPYADVSAGKSVISRFENLLKYYDLKSNGYEAFVRQVCFPMNGSSTTDLIRKALDEEMA